MSTATFANGQQLVSSALTSAELAALLQDLVCAMLGFDVTDAGQAKVAYATVRIDWPATGAPGFLQTEDVCFVRVSEEDTESVNRVREVAWLLSGDDSGFGDSPFGEESFGDPQSGDITTLIEQTSYTRVWSARFEFWGPNSYDRARLLRSTMFLDWAGDTLASSNLYPVVDIPAPTRAPELFEGGWWDRTDVRVTINEGITETIDLPTGVSVEVVTSTPRGVVSDVTIILGDDNA